MSNRDSSGRKSAILRNAGIGVVSLACVGFAAYQIVAPGAGDDRPTGKAAETAKFIEDQMKKSAEAPGQAGSRPGQPPVRAIEVPKARPIEAIKAP